MFFVVFLKQKLDQKPNVVARTYRCDKKGDCYGKLSITKLPNSDIQFSALARFYQFVFITLSSFHHKSNRHKQPGHVDGTAHDHVFLYDATELKVFG